VVSEVLAIFEHRDFEAVRAAYGGTHGIGEELARLHQLFGDLESMGLLPYVRFDLGIVRGLAYYTGVVFEIFDARAELRAIAGGGRYDDLLRVVSGTDLPALGFGMGDVVLRELLADRGLLPELGRTTDYYVVGVTPEQRAEVLRLAHSLRNAGHTVDYALRPQAVGKQLKTASALNASFAIVVGPDELAAGEVVVRTMASGEERRVALDELLAVGGP
jgi:histidyl-tRNA synthetase